MNGDARTFWQARHDWRSWRRRDGVTACADLRSSGTGRARRSITNRRPPPGWKRRSSTPARGRPSPAFEVPGRRAQFRRTAGGRRGPGSRGRLHQPQRRRGYLGLTATEAFEADARAQANPLGLCPDRRRDRRVRPMPARCASELPASVAEVVRRGGGKLFLNLLGNLPDGGYPCATSARRAPVMAQKA